MGKFENKIGKNNAGRGLLEKECLKEINLEFID
jgi:hypothetical protein